MTSAEKLSMDTNGSDGSLFVLAVLALVVGVFSGVVGALFLLLLERANRLRGTLIVWAHSENFAGFLVLGLGCAAPRG